MDLETLAKACIVLLAIGIAAETGLVAGLFEAFPVLRDFVYFYARIMVACIVGGLIVWWLYYTTTSTSPR
jgi:hypothetical protein